MDNRNSLFLGMVHLMENLVEFFQSAAVAIAIGVAAYFCALIVGVILRKLLQRLLGKAWSNFIASLSMLGIMLWAAKIILDYTGAAGAVVIIATAITGALAFGSERLASDVLGGLNILFVKPFEIGQYVSIGDYEGDVVNTNLTTTHLNSYDGTRIILRNSTVMDNTIINYSTNLGVRIAVMIPVPATEDLEKAALTLKEAVDSFEPQVRQEGQFLMERLEGNVICDSIRMGYAEFQVRVYIPTGEPFSANRFKLFIHATRALQKASVKLKF